MATPTFYSQTSKWLMKNIKSSMTLFICYHRVAIVYLNKQKNY